LCADTHIDVFFQTLTFMTKRSKQVKIYPTYQGNKQVSQLRLSGVWLEKLGFKIGDQVNITMREELLIIERIVEEERADYQTELKAVKRSLKQLSQ